MPLPSMIALPSKKPNNAQCDDLNLHMLPSELLAKILSFVDGDPCEQKFLQMCKCDSQFAGACRNDKLWEALCKRQRWDRPERTTGWHDMGKLTWKQQFFKWCDLRFKPYRPEEFNRIFKRPMSDQRHQINLYISEIDDNQTGRLKLRCTLETLLLETGGTGVLPETPQEFPRSKLATEAAKEVRKYGPIESWDVSRVTNMQELFSPYYRHYEDISVYYADSIRRGLQKFEPDISGWDVSNVTNMKGMFDGAYLFNADISGWDVSNVTDMSFMFSQSEAFDADIRKWNVSNVTNMSSMFSQSEAFNADIGSWDVSNVTNMSSMFYGSEAFNADIGSWDVSNVTDMSFMFYESEAFNADIGSWDVSNVTYMSFMFYQSEAFNADIGSWDVSNVTDMSFMFYGSEAFNADISRWNVMNVRNMRSMFQNSVFNQDLTEWNADERLHENDVDVSFMFQNSSLTQYPDWF